MSYLHSVVTAAAGLGVLAAVSASAQSRPVRAEIPFAFTAGSETLPAGEYEVSRVDSSRFVLLVRGPQGSVMLMSGPGKVSTSWEKTRLVFHRYGNAYFLRNVYLGGYNGYALRETQEERAWAERVAQENTGPEPVSIAATLK